RNAFRLSLSELRRPDIVFCRSQAEAALSLHPLAELAMLQRLLHADQRPDDLDNRRRRAVDHFPNAARFSPQYRSRNGRHGIIGEGCARRQHQPEAFSGSMSARLAALSVITTIFPARSISKRCTSSPAFWAAMIAFATSPCRNFWTPRDIFEPSLFV